MCTVHPTPADPAHLLEQYAGAPSDELKEAIVSAYLYIAQIVARKFSGRGVDYDDLFQVASLALFKAIDRFDISKGIKFVSFVTPSMVGEVKNYFRDRSRAIRIPRRGQQMAQALRLAREELEQELHRAPRVDELAQKMQMTEDEVLEAIEFSGASAPTSLDQQISEEEDDAPLSKFLGREESGYAEFERNDMLKRAMAQLDERQREIIRLRYFENLSQRDAADKLGVSQMTVSRAERTALDILRQQLA